MNLRQMSHRNTSARPHSDPMAAAVATAAAAVRTSSSPPPCEHDANPIARSRTDIQGSRDSIENPLLLATAATSTLAAVCTTVALVTLLSRGR